MNKYNVKALVKVANPRINELKILRLTVIYLVKLSIVISTNILMSIQYREPAEIRFALTNITGSKANNIAAIKPIDGDIFRPIKYVIVILISINKLFRIIANLGDLPKTL